MSFREGVDRMVDRVALAIGLNPDTAKMIQACSAVLQLKFPVKLNDKVEVFTGLWAAHSPHRLPAKGGLRFSTVVNQDKIKALAASFAFMLPVATPPNAIVFSSRYITIPQMAKVGFWLNILAVGLITIFVLLLLPLVWDVDLTVIPESMTKLD